MEIFLYTIIGLAIQYFVIKFAAKNAIREMLLPPQQTNDKENDPNVRGFDER